MDEFGFDVSGILTGEEAERLFSEENLEQPQENEETQQQSQKNENTPADDGQHEHQEEVSEEDDNGKGKQAAADEGAGSSPNVYSSIANALKDDGHFSFINDEDLKGANTPEGFAELFEKEVAGRLDEKQKRIDEALNSGVQPDAVKQFENTIEYLGSIEESALEAEGEEGEELRKQLIYNDLINKGFSQEKALRSVENSIKSGNDVEDAKDALDGLKKFYNDSYNALRKEAKVKADASKKAQKEQAEQFRKMILDDEVKFGEAVLDKKTKQKVFDVVSKATYKDPDTGRLMTEVQKFQKEKPLEFLKQIGLWYVLTDGGKNIDAIVKSQGKSEKNKAIRELEAKINSSSFNSDGTLKYAGGSSQQDILLSDDWKIG